MVGALWNVDTCGCYGVSTSLVLPWDLLAADHWIRVVGWIYLQLLLGVLLSQW